MKLAFTGHRPEALKFSFQSNEYIQLEIMLWKEIEERIIAGYNTFYCGAARGMDGYNVRENCTCGERGLS